jgi:hypothetical protein
LSLENKIINIYESLYLKEPINIPAVFSLRYGTFLEVKLVNNGVYAVKMPISGITNFYYENNRFIKSETSGNIQQMTIKPKRK